MDRQQQRDFERVMHRIPNLGQTLLEIARLGGKVQKCSQRLLGLNTSADLIIKQEYFARLRQILLYEQLLRQREGIQSQISRCQRNLQFQ